MNTSADRIAEMSKTVYTWCAARTSTAEDAEDLSQDVLLAMLQALPNLKDDRAFYGFMWSVARNVYRQWSRRKSQLKYHTALDENAAADPFENISSDEDVQLLRRELTLLNERFRKAAVLYYVKGLRTARIAQELSISESMAKYLLFKTRHILKEGMYMERNYGEQSYHPRRLSLRYWGEGPNHYYGIADTLLRQNILVACYHDALTAQQIALTIGVGLPYMEDDLLALDEVGLLTKDHANRYKTNIILFTGDFMREAEELTAAHCRRIADIVKACITEKESAIRALGFTGSGMNSVAFAWQMTSLLLHRAVIELAGTHAAPDLPADKWGVPCLCWGVEQDDASDPYVFGVTHMDNSRGDSVQLMDFFCNGEMVHHTLCRQSAANVFLTLTRDSAAILAENDEALAAEFVRKGYVLRQDGRLAVRCPVLSAADYNELLRLIDGPAQEIAAIALRIRREEAALLREHVPAHLQHLAESMVYFRLFEDAVSRPVALLCAEHFLPDAQTADLLPTTYVVLSE